LVAEREIWRIADVLIRLRGVCARPDAMRLAEFMLNQYDEDGWALWIRIRIAIEALQVSRQDKFN